jgi:protoporphyrinogen oxidase
MPQADQQSVVIVGGGFTGLAAAWRLARAGRHRLTVVERSSCLGGLAGDFALQGTQIEKTYHHLFATDRHILELARELGLADKLVWCESSVGLLHGETIYPFMSPRDILAFKPCHFFNRLRLGLVALYLQRKKDWRPLAGQAAQAWMRRACGREVMEVVWEPLLRGKFHRYADSISMAWLWHRIHSRGNSRHDAGSEKLGYFRGGFAVITNRIESELTKAGVVIQKNTGVDALQIEEGRPVLLMDGRRETFDRCVFTGPSAALARLLTTEGEEGSCGGHRPPLQFERGKGLEAYRRRLQSIDYLGAISLVFVSKQAIGEYYWLNINRADAPFLVFIRHTKLVDKSWYNGNEVYYIGSYQPHDSPLFSMSEEEISGLWFGFLKKIYPQFDAAQVVEKHLFKLKYAQHIVDTDYQSKIPACQTPLAGVWLCNFSQVYPEDRGTNYAVREGLHIADLLLQEAKC